MNLKILYFPKTQKNKIVTTDLVKFVPFAELHWLLPAIVTFVEVSCDAAKLDQLVFLQPLSESDVVKVVKCVDGRTETIVVFLVNEEIVQRLVYRFVVVTLDWT